MSIEEPIDASEEKSRTPEEEERIRSMIRAIVFVFLAVVFWYGLDLARF